MRNTSYNCIIRPSTVGETINNRKHGAHEYEREDFYKYYSSKECSPKIYVS